MNRRITKAMAEKAANIMKAKAYGQKIDTATAKIDAEVEKLVKKYVPTPVIACVNEYPDFIFHSNGVSITTIIERNKYTTTAKEISGKIPFKVPSGSNYIKVEGKDYDALLSLYKKKKQLEKERDDFGNDVCNALISLKTEKAVEKELPEAMKYLTFPEIKSVPMQVYTGLNDIIKRIK